MILQAEFARKSGNVANVLFLGIQKLRDRTTANHQSTTLILDAVGFLASSPVPVALDNCTSHPTHHRGLDAGNFNLPLMQ